MKRHIPESRYLPDVRNDFGFYDEKTRILIGWPGYRTRQGKSGLAYAETVAEEAHFEGQMLRWLYFEKFRTHNPIYLLFLFILALLCTAPPLIIILLGFLEHGNGAASIFYLILFGLPIWFGSALFKSIWLSLTQPEDISMTGD
jgi:hypothetical protein